MTRGSNFHMGTFVRIRNNIRKITLTISKNNFIIKSQIIHENENESERINQQKSIDTN
jgi:hypothetical protein